jgi:hypothetical protein
MPVPRYPARRWAELADELRRHRVQHLGYYKLKDFCDLPGAVSPQIVTAVENRRRDNFSPVTLDRLEKHYRLRPGAITDFLAGRAAILEPVPGTGPGPEAEPDPMRDLGEQLGGLLDPGELRAQAAMLYRAADLLDRAAG